MKKGTLVAAVAAVALMGVGASSAKAEPPVLGPRNNTVDMRVVNHYPWAVSVYVQDAHGRTHYMGQVRSSELKVLEIPGAFAAMGDVSIEIFPSTPARSFFDENPGVKTSKIPLKIGDAVNVVVESSLLKTRVEHEKG